MMMVPVTHHQKLVQIAELKRIAMERCNERILRASSTSSGTRDRYDHEDGRSHPTSFLKRRHGL